MCEEKQKKTLKRKFPKTYKTSKCLNLSMNSSLDLKKKCLEDLTDNYKQSGLVLFIFKFEHKLKIV